MASLEITPSEREILEEALGEYMNDAYGDENEEGAWTPEQWAALKVLAEKIMQAT